MTRWKRVNLCANCYASTEDKRSPITLRNAPEDVCGDCGARNTNGIYVRREVE